MNVRGNDSIEDVHASILGQEGSSGLVPVANANWNELGGGLDDGTGTIANLKDDTGAATSASFTSGLGNGWSIAANIETLVSGVTQELLDARVARLGLMGDGFRDANADADVTEVTLTDIPYARYNVILYYATGRGGFKWAPAKVTTADGTVTYYSYTGSETGAAATPSTSDPDPWGSSNDLVSAGTTGTYGHDVMLIEGLSGDTLSIDLYQSGNAGAPGAVRGGLFGFQIVEMLPSISVNFAGDVSGTHSVPIPETSDAYGLFPVPGLEWKNGFTGTGAIQVSSAYGSAETFSSTLSYKSKNIWYNTDSYDTLLKTYLDDGTKPDENITGASISMDNVPFTEYAVIVYCAGGNNAFLPVTVNGKTYTYQDNATVEGSANFGSSSVTKPTLGENALCVTGLTGSLTVQGRSGDESGARGGIAAIQIICTGKVDASLAPAPEAETSVVSLNFGSNHGSVPQTAETYGLVPVPGNTWTNISGAKGSQTVTVASGKPLTKEPTVAYDSATTYFYNSATDPFLKGYLDDGDGEGDKQGDGVGASVTVRELPFWAYDVVVYAGLGDANSVARPVRINDTLYTWDSDRDATIATDDEAAVYGGIQPTAQYGKNALRVRGLSDYDYELTVQGLPRINQSSQRGGIAAIQIVERKVIQDNNIGDLDPDSDTPVHILLTKQISGDLTLPPDAILDLSSYWLFGATPPITGTLTVNKGTQIRLPKGASWTIAGAISGTLAKNAVIVDGSLATGVKVNDDGTISADATYVWTGSGNNDRWSNQYNWSSHTVPTAEDDVTIPLAAGDKVTIELPADADAVAKSVTITGPESGTATLALTSAEGATGSLTVSGQMLTTGNVTVTQSADIIVNGKSTMVCPSGAPQTYPERGAFHVEGAQTAYNVVAGTLSVPTVPEEDPVWGIDTEKTAGGFVVVCGDATLTVGGGDSEAVLSVYRCSMSSPSGGVSRNGTIKVCQNGVFETDNNSWFSSGLKLVTEGGTVRVKHRSAYVRYGDGYAPTSPLTLSAPEGATLTFRVDSSTGTLLTGSADVSIKGPGTVALVGAIDAQTYTGEISVQGTGNLTLADNQRPKLSVANGASLTVTSTNDEAESGTIVFPTTMTEEPATPGSIKIITGVDTEGNPVMKDGTADVAGNQLTLSWEADYPTLSTSGSWSTETWTTSAGSTDTPSEGSATLDGTGEGGIEVTLDTDLSQMTSIFVKGNVTLVTKGTQSTTIPACVALAKGATLTVDANFSGAWELPAGTTLQVTKGFTSFAGLTLEGAVVILEGASGTDGTPTEIEALRPVEFNGGLTIAASSLTLKSVYNVGTTLALEGDNITIEGNSLFTDNGTRVVNTGTGNAITGVTGLNGSLAVEEGVKLALTLGASPTNTFSGATIAAGATLTLAAVPANPDVTSARNWLFPVTGDGTLVIVVGDYDFRPNFSAVSQEATTLPKHLVFTATEAEQAAGVISCGNNANSATLPEGLTVTVNPAEGGGAWVPNAVLEAGGNSYLKIYNVPVPNGLTGLDDEVALTLRQAAAKEGITNGDYTVQLKTGGQTVDATAAALNDVLGCFTGLTATASADKATLTYAYEFGIVGVQRTADGWEVVVKVTGAGGADAGFAAGNVYRINGEVVAAPEASAQAEAGKVVLPVTEDQLKAGVSVSVARPETP